MIDIKDKAAANADYELTADDILAWEAEHGKIPANSLVILNTGWNKKFETPSDYINMDDAKVMHFPGYHPDSAKLLIERDVVGVGIDTLSLDFGGSKTFAFHVAMLNANKYQPRCAAGAMAIRPTAAPRRKLERAVWHRSNDRFLQRHRPEGLETVPKRAGLAIAFAVEAPEAVAGSLRHRHIAHLVRVTAREFKALIG